MFVFVFYSSKTFKSNYFFWGRFLFALIRILFYVSRSSWSPSGLAIEILNITLVPEQVPQVFSLPLFRHHGDPQNNLSAIKYKVGKFIKKENLKFPELIILATLIFNGDPKLIILATYFVNGDPKLLKLSKIMRNFNLWG